MGRLRTLVAPAVLLLLLLPNSSSAGKTQDENSSKGAVHSYRYELVLRTGDFRFAGEIAPDQRSVGPRFDVETDKSGKILSVATWQNGKKIGQLVFHFEAARQWATGVDVYRGGELTARNRIERNSRGESSRIEYITVSGVRAAFRTQTYSTDHVDWTKYNSQGQPISHGTDFFSPEGTKIRALEYLDDQTTIETNFDPATGLELTKNTMVNGEVKIISSFTHDANGSLIREDIFNSKNKPYGTTEYHDGLRVRQSYKFTSGGTAEVLVSHDSKRLATEAKFSINEKLVCTFKFDRLADGGIRRTLAFGPEGDLYAEYPDHYVDQVQRDGSPTSQINGIVIYKKGNWW